MTTHVFDQPVRVAVAATLLAALLIGCAKPVSDTAIEPPPPSALPAENSPPAEPSPAPDSIPSAPTEPASESSPSGEPATAPKSLAAMDPALGSMSLATPSAKMSVAVDLRYSFDSDVSAGHPATLNLAAVPRVLGSNLSVSVQENPGLQIASGPLRLQKASVPEVYRQQVSVTKLAAAPAKMLVLVRMETAEGSGFGFFSIPLDGGTNPQKQDSVKRP